MIIIAVSLIAVGLLAYFVFFNGKSEEDNSLPSSYNGSHGSSKSSKKNKKTNSNSNNSQFTNGVSAQSDTVTPSQTSDSQSESFQSTNSRRQSQGYFSSKTLLQPNQIGGNSTNAGGSSSGGGSSSNFNGGSSESGTSSGGGGGTSNSGISTYSARMQACVSSLQPVLDAKSTDTTVITNALLNVMGFSMLPVATQNSYINSVATQSKGTSAENYCKMLLQNTNPQSIDVASLYTDCKTMVQNLYSQKGSNATEFDAINAFESLGIMNGATTSAQKKTILQNYLGGEYNSVITAMSNLNSTNLATQSNIICSKTSSGITNAVNGSSTYLSCITTVNSAKTNNITNVATALPSYANLTSANQTLMASYYKDFLSGARTAEFICSFLAKNATVVQPAAAQTLSDMVLPSTSNIGTVCTTVVNAIKSEYDDYLSNSDIDYVSNIVRKIDSYEFLISDTYKANIVKYLITQKITDTNFNTLSINNQTQVAKRLYATNYSLSSFTNPAISGIYTELFPQLCKCSHIDFDDIAWKNAIVSYMILKQGGGTAIPTNIIQKQALITTNDFYKSCPTNIKSRFSSLTISSTASTISPSTSTTITSSLVLLVQSIDSTYKTLTNIDAIVAPLSCYINQCIGKTCPQSCLQTVDSVCQGLTIQYLQNTPAATNMNTLFSCPLTDSGKLYDARICYNLTEKQRVDMAKNLYDTILTFKETASGVRKKIIENLWKTHTEKQKNNNTSVSSSQCVEQANNVWYEFLKPYSEKDTTQPPTS